MFRESKEKEFKRQGINPGNVNLVAPGGLNLLITQDAFIDISNEISNKHVKRVLGKDEISALYAFVQSLPVKLLAGLDYNKQISIVANEFVKNYKVYNSLIQTRGYNSYSEPNVKEYMKRELSSSDNNSIYNITGLAVQDNNGFRGKQSDSVPLDLTQENYSNNEENIIDFVKKIVGEKNLPQLLNDSAKTYANFQSLILRRHIIPFDSKNRTIVSYTASPPGVVPYTIVANPFTEYVFSLNFASTPGKQGVIRLQNIIQDFVRVEIRRFWFPVVNSPNCSAILFYRKMRLLIKELLPSSIQLDVNTVIDGALTVQYYHFELDVKEYVNGRVLLEMRNEGYNFNSQIKRLEKVTFMFLDPFGVVINSPDWIIVGPATLAVTAVTFVVATLDVTLFPGDIIYFNAVDPLGTQTKQFAYLNRPEGHVITSVTTPPLQTISIDYILAETITTYDTIQVYLGSRRVNFELLFSSVPEIV